MPHQKPYVILNAAMSLDGRITTKSGDSTLSNKADWKRVHQLRNAVDGIMVGKNTVLKDNPKLTVKKEYLDANVPVNHPRRIIVDSRAKTPVTANVLQYMPEVPTYIAITSRAPKKRIERLRDAGAHILVCGDGPNVDLELLLEFLYQEGIKKILLEGGGKLNWSMLSLKLINEIQVTIAPVISGGGIGAVNLFEGTGFRHFAESPQLILQRVQQLDHHVVLFYSVKYQPE